MTLMRQTVIQEPTSILPAIKKVTARCLQLRQFLVSDLIYKRASLFVCRAYLFLWSTACVSIIRELTARCLQLRQFLVSDLIYKRASLFVCRAYLFLWSTACVSIIRELTARCLQLRQFLVSDLTKKYGRSDHNVPQSDLIYALSSNCI
jgi:hypothetical protein